ncbi:SCO2524 family protein [Nocardia sp. XZ_19_385]|uniref:SCO2524 family protein n=1 Tax=Nocardia sp. XZ_19_385 TaxID=2769488 RepID=UPI00189098F4|nr:SCO2524 family protein [Nocardia sp. XZ_19_385]
MRIRPRQQLLDLWRAHLKTSYRDDAWVWGGRDGSNAISDAEQLMCLLYPATELASFALDPDSIATADDVASVLSVLGDDIQIGGALVRMIEEFFDRYTDADGEPIFAGGSYFRDIGHGEPTPAQRELDVVDAYSMSLSLCIAALRFLRGLQRYLHQEVRREARRLNEQINALTPRVSSRLTSAMVGLIRSFVIHTPPFASPAGQEILALVNQTGADAKDVIADFSAALEQIRVQAANDVRTSQVPDIDLYDDSLAFECGWSWGIDARAGDVDEVASRIGKQPGYAVSEPDLYFTLVVLEGIKDLYSQRTQEPDLLDGHQLQLAESLKRRAELTQRFWSTISRFGTGRWPLEDLPWRTSDAKQSDYYSLVVTAFLIQDLLERESTTDLSRTVAVLTQLAQRARIINREVPDDPAAILHYPGITLTLKGSEGDIGGPLLGYQVGDFSTLLLKRSLQAARLARDVGIREQLFDLATSAMAHMQSRAISHGRSVGLWDNLAPTGNSADPAPSWFLTERMMECLVVAHYTFSGPPLATRAMVHTVIGKITEAEHLLNQELLQISDAAYSPSFAELAAIELSLDRARAILTKRPHTAESLATDALLRLNSLAYAREDANR